MCGIVGYVGGREAQPTLIDGLRRLEYRGYDSSGLATVAGQRAAPAQARRPDRRPGPLCARMAGTGRVGISHTRWATHGPATDRNAHPHISSDGLVAVVHNGVIENYAALKRQLEEEVWSSAATPTPR